LDEQAKLLRDLVVSLTHQQRIRNNFNQTYVYYIGVKVAKLQGHSVDDVLTLETELNGILDEHTTNMATLQGHMRYAGIIFGDEISPVIEQFNAYIASTDYIYTGSENKQLEAEIENRLDKKKDIRSQLELFAHQFNKPKGHTLFFDRSKALLDMMQEKLKANHANLFEDVLH